MYDIYFGLRYIAHLLLGLNIFIPYYRFVIDLFFRLHRYPRQSPLNLASSLPVLAPGRLLAHYYPSQDQLRSTIDVLRTQPPKASAPTTSIPKGPYWVKPKTPPPVSCIEDQPDTWGPTPRQGITLDETADFQEELARLELEQG